MAGQGPSRRELLQALGLASAASAFAGFARWSYGFKEVSAQSPAQSMVQPVYRPQFFDAAQYQTVEVLADLILPAAHNSAGKPQPGAKQAGVAEFIDFMVYSDPTLQAPFSEGLRWLDRVGTPKPTFMSQTSGEQNAILERLAYKAKHRAGEEPGQKFFHLFRRYTVMGFYTTRIGLESLDYPGLTFYKTSPGCPHHDNPEHAGL